MMGFLRHRTQRLNSNKKSATFDGSTFRILIPSIELIPSQVAPQQSLRPFNPMNKGTKTHLTQFSLHSRSHIHSNLYTSLSPKINQGIFPICSV